MIHRKKCKTPFCKELTDNPRGYCAACSARMGAERRARAIAVEGTALAEKRPSAYERGYDSDWRKYAKDYLRRNPRCAMCGKPARCVDHKTMTAFQMLDRFGRFVLDDQYYQPLCIACNNLKGRRADKDSDHNYRKAKAEFEAGLKKI